MKNKYLFVAVMLLALMSASIVLTNFYVRFNAEGEGADAGHSHAGHQHSFDPADGKNQEDTGHGCSVVASFYPMYIAALNIIGDCGGVTLQNLSEPQTGCLHDYQLTTEDMKKLSGADVFLINGGGIEHFLADVTKQYPRLAVINACEDLDLLAENAHAWMSIAGYMAQVRTIAGALAELDPANAVAYQKNSADYLAKLEALHQKQQEAAKACQGRKVLLFHEAFAYVAKDYGLVVSGGMDLDEERQASAGETAEVLRQIREHGAEAILAEELYGRQMCETVKREADVHAIYLDTCVRGDYSADSYLDAMEENINQMRMLGQ
ncbi:MAG: metal ABC transporter substrate-binding protein [Eubacterium sp.]|nr:metal ABC transporter substrate-binding protein [Eubacterium sp.]